MASGGPSAGISKPSAGGPGGGGGPSTGATYGPSGRRQPIQWDDDDIRRRMRIVGRLYPGLKKKPKMLMSLAQQDIPDDHLIESVTKTAGFETIQRRAKLLKTATKDEQRTAWDQMDKTERQLLKQANYKPPPEPEEPGFFDQVVETVTDLPGIRIAKDLVKGDLTSAIEDTPLAGGVQAAIQGKNPFEVVGRLTGVGQILEGSTDAAGGVTNLAGRAGGDLFRDAELGEVANVARDVSTFAEKDVMEPALGFANTVSKFPEQMMRFDVESSDGRNMFAPRNFVRALDPSDPFANPINTEEIKDTGVGNIVSAGAGLLSGDDKPVKHFIDAWEKTAVGERYFPDRAVYAASEFVDDDPYSIEAAKLLAGGSSLEDIAGKYGEQGTQEYIDEYLHLQGLVSTEGFQKAVHTLENGKVSLGRDLSRTLGVDLDSPAGQVISGTTDAVVTWYTDPLLVAGKIRHAYKAKEAITTSEGLEKMWEAERNLTINQLGPDWEGKLFRGEISLGQVTKSSKRNANAAEIAQVFKESRARTITEEFDKTPLYRYFHQKFPQFEKTVTSLIDFDDALYRANRDAEVTRLGRKLTPEELKSIPGIRDSDDIWAFYNGQEGRMRLTSGHLGSGQIGNFYLPGLSRSARKIGEVRGAMTRGVEALAERGLERAGSRAEVLTGVAGMEAAAAEAPDVAEGYTRLYRVQGASGMPSGFAKYGRDNAELRWFDNIEQARAGGLGLGKFGMFTYTDVPADELARADNVTDQWLAGLGDNMNEYLLHPEYEPDTNLLGAVGDWAEIDGKVRPAAFRLLAPPARLAKALMQQVPQGTLKMWGPEMPTQFAKMLDMEYGSAIKGQLYDTMLRTSSPMVRREMARSVIDRIGYANGMYVTDAGVDAMARFTAGIDQMYALDGIDNVAAGTAMVPTGIGPVGDWSDQIEMPDWKLVGDHARRMGVLHTMLGPSQNAFFDAVIGRVWKPAMLFRLGFAPRAAAEEAMVTLLRAPHVYTEGALLRMAKAGDEPVVIYRDVARRAKDIDIYIPGKAGTEEFMDPLEKLAHYLPNWARGKMRGAGVALLDNETLYGAQVLADRPEILSSVADAMTKVGSYRTNWSLPEDVLGGTVRDPQYYIKTSWDGSTPDLPVRKGESKFVVYEKGHPDRDGIYAHQTGRFLHDPVQREVIRARNLFTHQAQADELAGQLAARGAVGKDSRDIVRQARDAVQADAEFETTYRRYLELRINEDELEEVEKLHGKLQDLAVASGDRNLMAVADAAHDFAPDNAPVLLINRKGVMAQLERPEPELSALDRELMGPHLYDSEQDVYDKLLNELPDIEPGMTRVFGRVGNRDEEQMAMATVRRQWDDLPPEQVPWKYVSTDPNDVVTRVMDDVSRAKSGQVTHTENLFYADVYADDLIEENGQLFLRERHRDATHTFGDDLGTELADVANWAQGIDGPQAARWADLAERAIEGDASAARELAKEVAKRQMTNPKIARNTREMSRSVMDHESQVARPLPQGVSAVYFPTFKPSEVEAAMLAVDPNSSTGRRFLALREDLSPNNIGAYDAIGEGPQYAYSRYASNDPEEVKALIEQLTDSATTAGQQLNIGLARVEIPQEKLTGYFTQNKGAVSSHDYEMQFADALQGTPIDLNGKLVGEWQDVEHARSPIPERMPTLGYKGEFDGPSLYRGVPIDNNTGWAVNQDGSLTFRGIENRQDGYDRGPLLFFSTHDQKSVQYAQNNWFGEYGGISENGVVFEIKQSAMPDVLETRGHERVFRGDVTVPADSWKAHVDTQKLKELDEGRVAEREYLNSLSADELGAHYGEWENRSEVPRYGRSAESGENPADELDYLFTRETVAQRMAVAPPEEREAFLRGMESTYQFDAPSIPPVASRGPVNVHPRIQGEVPFGNGKSAEEIMDSWAEVMNQSFDQLFMQNGKVKHALTVHGAHTGEIDRLAVFKGSIPDAVVGPVRYVPPTTKLAERIAAKGFDLTVTPLVNAVARTPLFVNNSMRRVALSDKLLRPIMENADLVEGATDLANKLKLKNVDELYSKMRNMPTSRLAAERLVDEGKLSAKWLHLSDEEWDLAHSYFKNEKITRDTIGSAAAEGALNDTIPYIDDHHVRSQFADEARNLIPFWWAQEAFLRRWAGTLKHSPEAIRKAQLIMQGARHTGIVYKDDEGNDLFMIPGSNEIMQVLMKPVQMVFGGDMKIPIPVGIEGNVRMATPGFDAVGVPGYGPLVAVPLAAARRVFPEMGAVEKGLLGEMGADRNELEHIFPAFMTRLFKAVSADPSASSKDPQLASAAISAMQYLEANGHGLPDDSTAREQQQYVDRVTHWARSMMVARAVFGWFDPAPTQIAVGEPEVAGEFQDLMRNVGLEEALSEMVKKYPDATAHDMFSPHHDVSAYAVAGTEALAGAPLYQTQAAQEFMDANEDFINKYPMGASWMLPQSNERDENVRSVRATQLELGLRNRKTPEEWYEDFKFRSAADVYFKSSEEFQIAREKVKTAKDRGVMDTSWKTWKTEYLAQHPVFAATINDATGVKRRKETINQLQNAFYDPALPDFPHKKELRVMLGSYSEYQTAISQLTGQRGVKVTETRETLKKRFATWAKTYTAEHPAVLAFYQRAIFPDLDLKPGIASRYDTEIRSSRLAGARM